MISPKEKSLALLSVTRSKAKMYEYGVPLSYHVDLSNDPAKLMSLAIGILGDQAADIIEIPHGKRIDNANNDLKFSAHYFDAYYNSKLNKDIDDYILLLGSASYYLCNLPGSSRILASFLRSNISDIEGQGLEHFVHWLLVGTQNKFNHLQVGRYSLFLNQIGDFASKYYSTGVGEDELFRLCNNLRKLLYIDGSPRQLLLGDIINATIRIKYENSTWRCLPHYSDIPIDLWKPAIDKSSFIKELWPSQHILGKQGVFKGRSAVIQMPTSAGKTKATELIIRSAFLSKRTELAVIVAPFKALCHEIKDNLAKSFRGENVSVEEFSEVIQDDIELIVTSVKSQIFVSTPEKLVYVLKQAPEFANDIGLLVYDEGHQFDSGSRGVTFELLLTTLKNIVINAQTVLISAVLSNVDSISKWLNSDNGEIVSGLGLNPNYRSIAFASWSNSLGQLMFVNEQDPSKLDYSVPRIIEPINLGRKKGAKADKYFPDKSNNNSISLYLALKLFSKGSVAIFCGTKPTAIAITNLAIDLYSRNIEIDAPSSLSDKDEIGKLTYLHEQNIGGNSNMTTASKLGIFSHHNNVPNGIRISVEYALRESLINFVLCTSTLSQGVNLPIRYLIVNGINQGSEQIKIRDFHNLIGRAGRSGMHTEGSIIFSNPEIFDGKDSYKTRWRWQKAMNLLKPENSEPCTSYLFTVFESFKSDDNQYSLPNFDILELAKLYIDGPANVTNLVDAILDYQKDNGFSEKGIWEQIRNKISIFNSIESYLMSYSTEKSDLESESEISILASSTLAYHLVDESNRKRLVNLFEILDKNIKNKIPNIAKRLVLGKTLYGLDDSLEIENWTLDNIQDISECEFPENLLDIIWSIISPNIKSKIFNNVTNTEVLKEFTARWINGDPFYELLNFLVDNEVEYKWGKKSRKITIEQIVDICQNSLSFEGSLAVGAVSSLYRYINDNDEINFEKIKTFQKMLQYGLPHKKSILIYELGFADRIVSMELSLLVGNIFTREEAIEAVRFHREDFGKILSKYPAYFSHTLDNII